MKKIIALLIILTLPGVALGAVKEQAPKASLAYHLKPALLEQPSAGSFMGGLDFGFKASYRLASSPAKTYRRSAFGSFDLQGLLTTDSNHNPRPITVSLGAGGAINLSGPKIAERGPRPGTEIIKQKGFYYGRASGSLDVGYETDQAGDNRNFIVGAKLGYVFTQPTSWYQDFIPSFVAAYDYVDIDKSQMQEQLGADDGDYQRGMVAASWKFRIGHYGRLPEYLTGLSLHFDLRFYHDFNRSAAIEDADKDQAHYFACSLNYTFKKALWGNTLTGIYLQFNDGRIPPATDDDTQVFLGVILWQGTIGR